MLRNGFELHRAEDAPKQVPDSRSYQIPEAGTALDKILFRFWYLCWNLTMNESQRRFLRDLRRSGADPTSDMNDSTDPKDPWEIGLLGGFIFSLGYTFGVAGVAAAIASRHCATIRIEAL
jgi:hypothetical protein